MTKRVTKIECKCEYCKKTLESRYPSKIPKSGLTFCDHKHAILFQRFDPKFANKLKELWKDPEFRSKQSEILKEAHNKPPYNVKITSSLQDPKVRKKLSEAMTRRWKDPEFKQKMVDFMTEQWKDPEFRSRAIKNREKERVKITIVDKGAQ